MARRTKRQKIAAPKQPKPPGEPSIKPAPARVVAPVDEPRFWFDFSLPWAKVAIVRVALFGILAVDAFLALRHAPRYGSGFNVGNLRFLDDLAPGRVTFALVELLLAYMFVLFACGVTLYRLPIATALYGWVYFSSQLDSYQHHYLVFLVLVLACFVTWVRPKDAPPDGRARSWAVRLILVQLGIVYAWAAVAKFHGVWLDGSALQQQIGTPWMVRMIDHLPGGFATAARMTLALELFLAFAIWSPRLWWFAWPLGVAFHVGIELSGLQIGLFSYVMVALYMIVLPDAIVVGAAKWLSAAFGAIADTARDLGRSLAEWPWIVGAIVSVLCFAVFVLVRMPIAPLVFVVVVIAAIVVDPISARVRLGAQAGARVLAAHLLAALAILALDHATTVSYDYYKFWGGSSRRLGHADDARDAYEHLLGVDPDAVIAHYYLGNMDAAAGRDDDALAHWHAAEASDPSDVRPFIAEARWLVQKGRTADAIAAARKAIAADPSSEEARRLADALANGGAAKPLPPEAPPRDYGIDHAQ
jgi:hypothetical protein